ncbi:GNAT family N-acetyltransferase [Vibrio sp. ZSDE26]|uniref:GNAT family N-acetyltransferase n=1 Tax=Vibrio amylolyticus TaxID=2847292 RepID=A0A9X2BGB1_9VIBR|nr:GNAT family N-acetyltransferase [Vibrio amylolyticus]MCK6261680.1 GNAT family N-acetyltransferase [Vibrio amylolyticus]
MQGYRISTQSNEMDIDVIHSFISTSYWAKGIPKATMQKAIDHSLCFGVFDENQNQIGFARTITDYTTYAYLADVFILEHHRGKGLSKWLINTVLEHPDLQGLRRIVLATRDAHGLYAQNNFKPLSTPENMMEIWTPNIYQL